MPATARRGAGGRKSSPAREVLTSGPYKGVKSTTDPFDDTPDLLVDAVNMYVPDAGQRSGIYARPGFALMNASNQLGGANHQGQEVYHHSALDGTEYNFAAISGKLYRVSADLTVYTDVTPIGATIDGSTTTRVFMQTFADTLIVSDGVNRPWYGTNLGATPITGTNIQFDAGNSLWSAFGRPEVYSGALVFILNTVAGGTRRTTITWSEPNDQTLGYFQTNYDNTWALIQTGTTPIFAICGTNVALLYWRDCSIGALSGAIGPNFKTTATHDAIDFKIGTRSPATVALHGNTVFFCDTDGKPQMLPLGNRLVPIWLQMRSIVENARTDTPQATQLTACGTVYSSLNLYVVAIWSPSPTINLSANTLHVFDVITGQYVGRWVIGGTVNIEAVGILKDLNGQPELVVIGTKVAAVNLGFGGYVWRLTNPQENVWTDNGQLPVIQAQTSRMGFAVDQIRYADRATAITGSAASCTLSVLTPAAVTQGFITDFVMTEGADFLDLETLDFLMDEGLGQATATPTTPTVDGTYRLPFGLDSEGRGFNLTISPTTATSQWRLHRLELETVVSQAPVEEA